MNERDRAHPIRAIVFDFDGVIAESVDIKTDAFRALFADRPDHVEEIVALHLDNMGVSRYEKFATIYRDLLHQTLDEHEVARLDRRFSELVVERVVACPLVEGALPFLEFASARFACFVASATPDREIREIVERRGLAHYFRGVSGSPTTKAEFVHSVLDQHGLAPDTVVFVGDARSDLVAAADSGVHFIGRVAPGARNPFPSSTEIVSSLAELNGKWERIERLISAPSS